MLIVNAKTGIRSAPDCIQDQGHFAKVPDQAEVSQRTKEFGIANNVIFLRIVHSNRRHLINDIVSAIDDDIQIRPPVGDLSVVVGVEKSLQLLPRCIRELNLKIVAREFGYQPGRPLKGCLRLERVEYSAQANGRILLRLIENAHAF